MLKKTITLMVIFIFLCREAVFPVGLLAHSGCLRPVASDERLGGDPLATPDDLCRQARIILPSRRFSPETGTYLPRYDEAAALARRALLLCDLPEAEVDAFIREIDAILPVVVDDPREAWELLLPRIDPRIDPVTLEPARFLFEIKRKAALLERLTRDRYQNHYIQTIAVPDRTAGVIIDTVGTPGSWEFTPAVADQASISSEVMVRFADAVCDIIYSADRPAFFGALQDSLSGKTESFGEVTVVDTLDQTDIQDDPASTCYASPSLPGVIVRFNPHSQKAKIFVERKLLAQTRLDLRRSLRDGFADLKPVQPARGQVSAHLPVLSPQIPDAQRPQVMMIDFSTPEKRMLGPLALQRTLELQGIPVTIAELGQPVRCLQGHRPIFCLSMLDGNIENANNTIRMIRKRFPDAFIVVGGPSAMSPKSLISLIPDIDFLIRGEGEESLAALISVLSGMRRGDRFTDEQIERLRAIQGLFARTPGLVMLNRLNLPNAASPFPVIAVCADRDSKSHRVNITRGCPFGCKFCTLSQGHLYRHAPLADVQDTLLNILTEYVPLTEDIERKLGGILRTGDLSRESLVLMPDHYVPARCAAFSRDQALEVLRIFHTRVAPFTPASLRDIARAFNLTAPGEIDSPDALANYLPPVLNRTQMQYLIMAGRRMMISGIIDRGEDLFDHGLNGPPLSYLRAALENDDPVARKERHNLLLMAYEELPSEVLDEVTRLFRFKREDALHFKMRSYPEVADGPADSFTHRFYTHLSGVNITRDDFIALLQVTQERWMGLDERTLAAVAQFLPERIPGKPPSTLAEFGACLPDTVSGLAAANAVLFLQAERTEREFREKCARGTFRYADLKARKQLITVTPEEDNTLVNKKYISELCHWIIDKDLARYFRFHAGQNAVTTLLGAENEPDIEFIRLLSCAGFYKTTLGFDGPSNYILRQIEKGMLARLALRQSRKRPYILADTIKLQKTLLAENISVSNNNQCSTPYAVKSEAVESILLLPLGPLVMRREASGAWYSNVYIWASSQNQFTSEYVIDRPEEFVCPADEGSGWYLRREFDYVPKECPEYGLFYRRFLYPADSGARTVLADFLNLIPEMSSFGSEGRMLDFLEASYAADVEGVVRRWQSPQQEDPELRALGEILHILMDQEGLSLFAALRRVREEIWDTKVICFGSGFPLRFHSFSDLLRSLQDRVVPAGAVLGSVESRAVKYMLTAI